MKEYFPWKGENDTTYFVHKFAVHFIKIRVTISEKFKSHLHFIMTSKILATTKSHSVIDQKEIEIKRNGLPISI